MKNIYITIIVILVLSAAACRKDESLTKIVPEPGAVLSLKSPLSEAPSGNPYTRVEIDKIIASHMDAKKDFSWEWTDVKTRWSAVYYSDHILAVGYKPSGYGNIEPDLHRINLQDDKWKKVHDAIIELVLTEINKHAETLVSSSDIIVEDDPIIPVTTFRLSDRNAITALYNLENVRYIEPLGYWPDDNRYRVQSTSGCNGSSEPLNHTDYVMIPPNCRVPWNYFNMNIPYAWSISEGAGIKIGIIDGGISASQPLLGGLFNNGYSNVNRTITTDYTYGSSVYSSCTHGNSMSGLAVAPRNDQQAITGVAYKSSLHFIRGCEDVVLEQSAEKTGVKNALIRMGNIADIRIISMSIGTPFASSLLRDGVVYAYNSGKMIFAAAGTSFTWTSWWGVVYPAAYNESIAVTGIRENNSTCGNCHDGSKVKFTVVMERTTNNDRNSLSLPQAGYVPTYVGGSSAATATAAGIAALVWSARPTLSRTQVYDCLKNTAANYPNFSSSHGYGRLNALAAVIMAATLQP